MKSIASAPGKIILFGEHFVVHGTKAILAAIDKRVEVTSTFTEKEGIKINSNFMWGGGLGSIEVPISSSYEEVKSEFRPFVYLVNKMVNSNQNVSGLEITIDSGIPVGVGLGSSSACCVAATASISGLFKELSSEEILKISIEAEKTIFPDTSGADCTVCTYGGMIEYDKIKGIEKIDSTSDLLIVIWDSGIQHSTKRTVERVNKFKENNEERFSQLCALENKLIDEVKLAMKNNDLDTIGLKMSENQQMLEEINVSNTEIRNIISALNKIWFGSKITGAGDGGCVIALANRKSYDTQQEQMMRHMLLGDFFPANIDTKGVVWSKIEE